MERLKYASHVHYYADIHLYCISIAATLPNGENVSSTIWMNQESLEVLQHDIDKAFHQAVLATEEK